MKKLLTITLMCICSVVVLGQQEGNNPFAKYGYTKVKTYTSSKGEFEKFHDQTEVVQIGSVWFNPQTNKIDSFVREAPTVVPQKIRILKIRLSVDPEAARYYCITPYNYCLNNPVKMIDQNGRDVWEMDETGRMKMTKQEGNDVLVAKNGAKQELSGNGVLAAAFSEKKDETGKTTETSFSGLSGEDARSTFRFTADNSNVEWGYMESINKDGNSEFLVGSAHNPDGESLVFTKAMSATEGSVIRYDHSHPNDGSNITGGGNPSTSRTSADPNKYSDVGAWGDLLQRNPNATLGIRFNKLTVPHIKGGKIPGWLFNAMQRER